jgi:hypothetical protein
MTLHILVRVVSATHNKSRLASGDDSADMIINHGDIYIAAWRRILLDQQRAVLTSVLRSSELSVGPVGTVDRGCHCEPVVRGIVHRTTY